MLNKIDVEEKKINRNTFSKHNNIVEVSAKEYLGLETLYGEIRRLFNLEDILYDNDEIITNIRHMNAINETLEKIVKAEESILSGIPIDISAFDLKDAMESLSKITGENVSEDIINEIFSKFCLGK